MQMVCAALWNNVELFDVLHMEVPVSPWSLLLSRRIACEGQDTKLPTVSR